MTAVQSICALRAACATARDGERSNARCEKSRAGSVVACAVFDAERLDRRAPLVCAVLVALAAVPAALAPLWDADLWWILHAGDELLTRGAVPRVNGWSWLCPDHAWVMHEWGFGALYALLARADLSTLALVRLAAVSLVAGAASWRASRDARPWVACALVALTVTLFGGRFESARPVGIAHALACALAMVAFEEGFAMRHAAVCVALSLVWANAHGSVTLAWAVLAIACGVSAGDRRARVVALVGSVAATFATPHGAAMPALAWHYLRGDGALAVVHARIVEWWPLWRAPLAVVPWHERAGLAAVALVAVAGLRTPRWRPRSALVLVLTVMALRHARHAALAGLVGAPLMAAVAGAWTGGVPRRRWIVEAAVPWALGLVVWGAARGRDEGAWIDASAQDEALRAWVTTLPAGARVFAELPYAGFVRWAGGGRVRVFFDPRNDCYEPAVLTRALDLNDGRLARTRTVPALVDAGTTHAVARCASSFRRAMPVAPDWQRDGVCAWTLSRTESPAL